MRLALLLVLAAAGCNSILGVGDVHLSPDGHGADAAGDAAPDAPPNALVGTSVITYVKADGTTAMKNEDLTRYTIGAYYFEGSGTTYQHVVGTGTADGKFSVIGVPADASSILLELTPYQQPTQLFAVRSRELDAGWITAGRPDTTPTTMPTQVALSVTGMSPWQDGDLLTAISYSTATEVYLPSNQTWSSPPTSGATSVTGTFDWRSGVDYMSGGPPRLVQASAGDDFYLEHGRFEFSYDPEGNQINTFHLVDLFPGTGVDITDGAPATVSGAFTALSANQQQTVTLPLAQDRAFAAEGGRYLNEDYRCTRTLTTVTPSQVTPSANHFGPAVWSATDNNGAGHASSVTLSGAYAYPFPDTWPSLLSCTYSQGRMFLLPGGQFAFDYCAETVNAPATSNFVAAPMIPSPINARIDGKPFLTGGTIPFDGTEPVRVEWNAVQGAAYYLITVKGQHPGLAETVARISTSDFAVDLPAPLFEEGTFYTVTIAAEYEADEAAFADGQLRRSDPTSGSTSIVSGLYLFSSKCGNNVVDSGEQCDTGGDSATCDADCSTPTCGDGYVNTMAGEVCDNGLDSETCDRDCTPTSCGDGHLNHAAGEMCDDGGNTPGDGCSAACQVESGWTCDGGSPTTCTMSLTAAHRRRRRPTTASRVARHRR